MLEAVHVQQQTNKSFTFMWPLSIHKYFKIVVPGLTDVMMNFTAEIQLAALCFCLTMCSFSVVQWPGLLCETK